MRSIYLIMPCFNGEKYLKTAIESFIHQDYEKKYLLIIDNKSTDNSHLIISHYIEQNSNIQWIKHDDKGISDAINIAVSDIPDQAIFGYLGADDLIMPGTLRIAGQSLLDFNFANSIGFESITHYINKASIHHKFPCNSLTLKSLSKHGTIIGLQNFYCEAKIIKSLKFDIRKKFAMDFDLYYRASKLNLLRTILYPHISSINIQHNNITTKYALNGYKERIQTIIDQSGQSFFTTKEKIKLSIMSIKASIKKS